MTYVGPLRTLPNLRELRVMKGPRLFCVLLASACLWGCGYVNAATVLNLSGSQIYVLHVSDREDRNQAPVDAKWSWPWRWQVAIANDETANLLYNVFREWIVEIDDGRCRSWYRIPQFTAPRREADGRLAEGSETLTVTNVRLAPDHLIYADVSNFPLLQQPAGWQPPGYPVHPFEQRCEPS